MKLLNERSIQNHFLNSKTVLKFRKNKLSLPPIGSGRVVRPDGLKGNRVKVPNSPAAVKLIKHVDNYSLPLDKTGKVSKRVSQSEDLPSFLLINRTRGIGRLNVLHNA